MSEQPPSPPSRCTQTIMSQGSEASCTSLLVETGPILKLPLHLPVCFYLCGLDSCSISSFVIVGACFFLEMVLVLVLSDCHEGCAHPCLTGSVSKMWWLKWAGSGPRRRFLLSSRRQRLPVFSGSAQRATVGCFLRRSQDPRVRSWWLSCVCPSAAV